MTTALMIVPTLRVGMHFVTLCVTLGPQSGRGGIPAQSVGTICSPEEPHSKQGN